jgi:hypothetical protein
MVVSIFFVTHKQTGDIYVYICVYVDMHMHTYVHVHVHIMHTRTSSLEQDFYTGDCIVAIYAALGCHATHDAARYHCG